MKVYSFPRGGLSFEDSTVPPRHSSVVAFLPALSVIPLTQLPGGKLIPLVRTGDTVHEGMLVARGTASNSANVHATVPGKIVRTIEWKDNEGGRSEALVVRMQGSFRRLGKNEELYSYENMQKPELQQILYDCGVVEMEGSGKPVTASLLSLTDSPEPQTLVVRCVFDDPWLAADYVLCRERLKAVVEGSFIIARFGGKITRVVFAVSQGEKDIGEAMLAESSQYGIPSSLVFTGAKYPQRNRRELELVLRDYGKKENLDLGTLLVLGPATLAAAHDAVKYRRPILDRYVAVGGSAVKNPQVMKVRIGKRIDDLFEECGGFIDTPCRIATGSPLIGKPVINIDEPVTKTSFAVFAMLKAQAGDSPRQGCISCGECRRVCPVGLDPEEVYKKVKMFAPENHSGSLECHGCGCCEIVCPSHLPLSDLILGRKTEDRNA